MHKCRTEKVLNTTNSHCTRNRTSPANTKLHPQTHNMVKWVDNGIIKPPTHKPNTNVSAAAPSMQSEFCAAFQNIHLSTRANASSNSVHVQILRIRNTLHMFECNCDHIRVDCCADSRGQINHLCR